MMLNNDSMEDRLKCRISNCEIKNCEQFGVYCGGCEAQPMIDLNKIFGTRGFGIVVDICNYAKLKGNKVFENCDTTLYAVYYLLDCHVIAHCNK